MLKILRIVVIFTLAACSTWATQATADTCGDPGAGCTIGLTGITAKWENIPDGATATISWEGSPPNVIATITGTPTIPTPPAVPEDAVFQIIGGGDDQGVLGDVTIYHSMQTSGGAATRQGGITRPQAVPSLGLL